MNPIVLTNTTKKETRVPFHITSTASPTFIPSSLIAVDNTPHKFSTAKCRLVLKRGWDGALKPFFLHCIKNTPVAAPQVAAKEAWGGRKIFHASKHTLIKEAKSIVTELQKHEGKISSDFLQQAVQLEELLAQLEKLKSNNKIVKQLESHFARLFANAAAETLPLQLRLKIAQHQHDWQMFHLAKAENKFFPLKIANGLADGVDKAGVLGLQIPSKFMPVSLVTVGGILSTMSNYASIPGSLTLTATSMLGSVMCHKRSQQLHGDKNKLREFIFGKSVQNSSLSSATKALDQLLSRQISQQRHLFATNAANIVSGITSLAASISGLAVLPTAATSGIVSFILVGLGALLNSAANLYQDRVFKWRDKLIGTGASESAQRQAAEMIKFSPDMDINEVIQKHASFMNTFQEKVATSKLNSLIQAVLKDARKNKIGHDAHSLYAEVERRADKLVGRLIQGTSLLKSDLDKMKAILRKQYPSSFFEGDLETLQAKLNDKLKQNIVDLKLTPSEGTLAKIHKEANEEFFVLRDEDATIKKMFMTTKGKTKKHLTADELTQLCKNSPRAQAIFKTIEARYLIQQIKIDSKFLRHDAALHLMNAVRVGIAQRKTVIDQILSGTKPELGIRVNSLQN